MKNENEAPSRHVGKIIKKIFANPWTLAALLTLLGVIAVYIGAKSPSARKLAAGGVFGGAIGLAYAVEVRCRVSEWANRFICAVIGAIAGGVICLLLLLSMWGVMIGVMVGFILGGASRDWIGHVNLP